MPTSNEMGGVHSCAPSSVCGSLIFALSEIRSAESDWNQSKDLVGPRALRLQHVDREFERRLYLVERNLRRLVVRRFGDGLDRPREQIDGSGEEGLAVQEVKAALEERDLKVWIDRDQLRPGNAYVEDTDVALNNCRCYLLIVSPSATEMTRAVRV